MRGIGCPPGLEREGRVSDFALKMTIILRRG
jgi:hypothetical protein